MINGMKNFDSEYSSPQLFNYFSSNTINKELKGLDLMGEFEFGLQKDSFKRLNLRKDAMIILKNKEKDYKILEKLKNEENFGYNIKKKMPTLHLKNGLDLFELEENTLKTIKEVYELDLREVSFLDLDKLSYLPNLSKIKAKFIDRILFDPILSSQVSEFFTNLLYLDLSFNRLNNNIFNYIKSLKFLLKLNLCGNLITNDIPDISDMQSLKSLNLSYNRIKSKFLTNLSNNVASSTEDMNFKMNDKSNINWPSYLKTDIQTFFNKLSCLRSLEYLNVSYNKIHFFDMDLYLFEIQEAFPQLTKFDLSHNIIEEELGVILVVKIPKLKHLNICHNPVYTKDFSSIEYEIFRNKEIIFAREKVYKNPLNKIIKGKNYEEILNKKNYLIKKEKIESTHHFSKVVKNKIEQLSQFKVLLENEQEDLPGTKEDEDTNINNNNTIILNETNNPIAKKKLDTDFFITNKNELITKLPQVDLKVKDISSYDQFLSLANKCFGKEIHYKKSLPIIKAYNNLRFILNNLVSDKKINENLNYMKPTISKQLHMYKESNNLEKTRIGMSIF